MQKRARLMERWGKTMLGARDIRAEFTHFRRGLALAGLGVIITMLMTSARGLVSPHSLVGRHSDIVLMLLFVLLIATVLVTVVLFRLSLAKLAELAEQRSLAANRDPLTGALNRAAFLERVRGALRSSEASGVGYIHVDMDNLKVVNDTYGHKAGDVALTRLVAAIRSVLPQALVGRLGGDEFGVLLAPCATRAALSEQAQAILDALARPVDIKGVMLELSATLGVALGPEDGDCVEVLLANADLALYAGKGTGRGRVVAYERDMSADERQRRFVERELRGAILMNQLTVHYQAIVDISGRAIGHYEALVRWEHPYRGVISPAVFIPVAEHSRLIDSLGEWVLLRVCRDRVALGARRISVNVSLVQLRRAGFAQRFLEILAQTGTPPGGITIEVTETVQLKAQAQEMRNLEALIAAGVHVAIDDFGSGATSLDYLRRLRFDAIKIDGSYIESAGYDPVSMALIAAVANIGRALNIPVVAEGVETEEQWRLLQAAGCTHLQGFLFGRPQALQDQPEDQQYLAPSGLYAA